MSPVTRPKKPRASEQQSDEDWAVLIGSQHHSSTAKFMPQFNIAALQLRPHNIPTTIMETPVASGSARASAMIHDGPSTPAMPPKVKRPTKKETLGFLDETPMPSKLSLGKARIPPGRFQKSLEKGR